MDDGTFAEVTGQTADPQANETLGGTWPDRHMWAKHESDMPAPWSPITQGKKHNCGKNLVQRGDMIFCIDGNHGMQIPQEHKGKMLIKDANGQYGFVDCVVYGANGKPLDQQT